MKRNGWYIFLLVFFVGLVLFPLLRRGFYLSDDGEWMIIRLSAFFQSLRDGQIPVRFLGRLNHGYGYPVANFLYPGYLYIGSFLHGLGVSFVDSVKLILGGSIASAAFFLHAWLRRFFGRGESFAGTLVFVLSPYVLFDLYSRGSVGEVLAFAAVAASLYCIESQKKSFFTLSFALLLLSHNSLAILFIPFLLAYLFLRRKQSFFLYVILAVGMTTFFWFPALYERRYVVFDTRVISDSVQYFTQSTLLAIKSVVVPVLLFLFFRRRFPRSRVGRLMFIVCAIGLFFALPVSSFLWTGTFVAKFFQFPYRFLAPAVIAASWGTASLYKNIKPANRLFSTVCIVGILGLTSFPFVNSVSYVDRSEGYYTTNEDTTTVAREYMPRWVSQIPTNRAPRPVVIFSGNGVINNTDINSRRIRLTVTADDPVIVQFHTIYYPGWGALVDGQKAPIVYDNDGGLMRLSLLAGRHDVLIEFRETVERLAADAVTVASLIAFVLIPWVKKSSRKIQ